MNLQSVYAEFESRFSQFGRVVVAGGAVRDTLMGRTPKDFDVFVSGEFDGTAAANTCLDLKPIDVYPGHKYEPFMRGQWYWNGVEVQVMATPANTPEELLSKFDWSCSLFAFDGEFHRGASIDHIVQGGELYLNHLTYPESSLSRGYRFANRFGMKIRKSDLVSICAAVVEKASKP